MLYYHINDYMEYKKSNIASNNYSNSIDTIITKYHTVIPKYIRSLNCKYDNILSDDDIDDVVQNVYIKLMSSALAKYRGECSLKNYILYYVARSVFLDTAKEKTKIVIVRNIKKDENDDSNGEFEIRDDRNNPETVFLGDELKKIIDEGLNNLSQKEKIIFIMIEYDSLTQQQVAQKLKISQPTVSEHYNNAKIKLQKILKEKHPNYVDSLKYEK